MNDRRRAPRLDVFGQIQVTPLTPGQEVRLHDLSAGGFCLESGSSFFVDRLYRFRFEAMDGFSTELLGRCVWIRSLDVQLSAIGFEFANFDANTAADIGRLLDSLTSNLSFD
jgi:hypothetical protein